MMMYSPHLCDGGRSEEWNLLLRERERESRQRRVCVRVCVFFILFFCILNQTQGENRLLLSHFNPPKNFPFFSF
ncbi:hypothetical protein RJT34_17206 [Clitoria ternatea]|uniref:Uncharacterized protein n=1 Tax=Clitoria ternatea TaxID=43366 RepID=A0AAN9PD08_CLITE